MRFFRHIKFIVTGGCKCYLEDSEQIGKNRFRCKICERRWDIGRQSFRNRHIRINNGTAKSGLGKSAQCKIPPMAKYQ